MHTEKNPPKTDRIYKGLRRVDRWEHWIFFGEITGIHVSKTQQDAVLDI